VTKKNLGLQDILVFLPSLRLKIDFILQKFPTIMPRYYTIASSALVHPADLHMAVSLTTYTIHDGSNRQGLASAFFEDRINRPCEVRAFIKSSAFIMPPSTETPLIMIGPGTGIVPFIGFMQERKMLRE
jgi:NADPH-ferrihemoprotein reductase